MSKKRKVFSPFGKSLITMITCPFIAGLIVSVIKQDINAGGLGFLFSFAFFIIFGPVLLTEYFEYQEDNE